LEEADQVDVAGRMVTEDDREEVFAKRAMVRSGKMSANAATAPTMRMPAVNVMAWA
jgi:hypothetical protein